MKLNVSYDVELIIYRLIHKDYTQKLNSEYKRVTKRYGATLMILMSKSVRGFMYNYRTNMCYPVINNLN